MGRSRRRRNDEARKLRVARPWTNGGLITAGAGCPTPDKRHYITDLAAIEAIRLTSTRSAYHPTRTYRCRCGWWALTSKPRRDTP